MTDDDLKILVPAHYAAQPAAPGSMRSAGIRFGPDGRVPWDQIWGSFCDLAMAGGPPHRGTLLEPATPQEIAANPGRYRQVVDEICRGITLTTALEAEPSTTPGWVRVDCRDRTLAQWLQRAITMENVSARNDHATILLPAGPAYRIEKEIKNVIVSVTKTLHYWRHMPRTQHQAIATLFATPGSRTHSSR